MSTELWASHETRVSSRGGVYFLVKPSGKISFRPTFYHREGTHLRGPFRGAIFSLVLYVCLPGSQQRLALAFAFGFPRRSSTVRNACTPERNPKQRGSGVSRALVPRSVARSCRQGRLRWICFQNAYCSALLACFVRTIGPLVIMIQTAPVPPYPTMLPYAFLASSPGGHIVSSSTVGTNFPDQRCSVVTPLRVLVSKYTSTRSSLFSSTLL